MIALILRLAVFFFVVGILYCVFIRDRKNTKKEADKIEYEIDFLTEEILDELKQSNLGLIHESPIPEVTKIENIRVNLIRKNSKIISAILYSWPSGLWEFRKIKNDMNLLKFSHIFMVEVDPDYRGLGYFNKMMDDIIFDTHRISEGITLNTASNSVKELFRKEYGFRELDENTIYLKFEEFSIVY